MRRRRLPPGETGIRVEIVVNSGPLISLARVGQLHLLPALFGEVKARLSLQDRQTLIPRLNRFGEGPPGER